VGVWSPGFTGFSPGRGPSAFLRRARTAAGGSWVPSDKTGLLAWYKGDGTLWQDSARTTGATADTDPVGSWDDESGNAEHLTQGTSANRPTLQTAELNSLAVVRGDGTNDALGLTDLGTLTDATIAVLFKSATTGRWPMSFQGGAMGIQHEGATSVRFRGWGVDTTGSNNVTVTVTSNWRWVLFKVVSGGTGTCYVDGTSRYTFSPTGTQAFGQFGLFARSDPTEHMNGDIAEALVYDSAISDGDRGNLDSYISGKWATF
jgi:hypothetical protein